MIIPQFAARWLSKWSHSHFTMPRYTFYDYNSSRSEIKGREGVKDFRGHPVYIGVQKGRLKTLRLDKAYINMAFLQFNIGLVCLRVYGARVSIGYAAPNQLNIGAQRLERPLQWALRQ
ncbi:hypothetical protein AVEN_230435-1 [Araneus ventricosus]|uniref:Uncharacterized protein n=1 Tax=Araneus ventricosus TaxID=182803 RepID=A0A4Y2LIJ5_ARAVE|nr:hypothetical protein AVEN_230435-1 [Araneus ventricosus]